MTHATVVQGRSTRSATEPDSVCHAELDEAWPVFEIKETTSISNTHNMISSPHSLAILFAHQAVGVSTVPRADQ